VWKSLPAVRPQTASWRNSWSWPYQLGWIARCGTTPRTTSEQHPVLQ
jgi:hypothetical protein